MASFGYRSSIVTVCALAPIGFLAWLVVARNGGTTDGSAPCTAAAGAQEQVPWRASATSRDTTSQDAGRSSIERRGEGAPAVGDGSVIDYRTRLRAQRAALGPEPPDSPTDDDQAAPTVVTVGRIVKAKSLDNALGELGLVVVADRRQDCQKVIDSYRESHTENVKALHQICGEAASRIAPSQGHGMDRVRLARDPRRGRAKQIYVNNTQAWVYEDEMPEMFRCFDRSKSMLESLRGDLERVLR